MDGLAQVAQDIVVTGHDRDEIGFLIFPNFALLRLTAPHLSQSASHEDLIRQPSVRAQVARGLADLKQQGGGSASYAARALLMLEPPSIDAGEITDKAYINQRMVLTRRADLVLLLHAEHVDKDVTLPARDGH